MNVTPGTTIDQPGHYVLNGSFTNSSEGIEITSSDVVLDGQGHTLAGTDLTNDPGVHAQGTESDRLSNVTVKNLTLDNWPTGLAFTQVDSGHTHNIVASNNSDTGIRYHYVTNGIITNSTVRETGVNTGADGWGISLLSSDNNTLRGNNVSDPGTYVTGLEIDGQNNTVTRNYISGPQWAPVILTDDTVGNLVYDNYLNGLPPYEFDNWEWSTNTTWNVSKRPGPNIMGGPYIGGNYWAKPDGTGFSQTHVDADGDGFVDRSHRTDRLPLTRTPGVEPGNTIDQPGNYVLTRSFVNSSGGIDISSSDVVLDGQGHTLDGSESSSGDGVFVFNQTVWDAGDRLSNVTVKNLTLTDWSDGVQFAGVDDARTENVVAARNSENGLHYFYANNGSIAHSKSTGNDDAGVKLDTANNSVLMDSDVRDNPGFADGVLLENSHNNTVAGNNITRNGDEGLDLSDSNNNTITRNRVSHNDDYGIDVVRSYTNLIYDNYFENEVNAHFFGNKSRYNTWNVSKQSGTNIVGDPFIGGNYWATPAGTGFSQTNPDFDRDGFSDGANTLFFSDHTDRLPLSNAHDDTEPPESNITDLSTWFEGFTLVGNDGFFDPGDGVWYVAGNTSVRGFASDESAVRKVFFSSDDGATWTEANLSSESTYDWFNRWRPTEEGTYHLRSKAQDVAGNNESTGTATVIVDRTPPEASLSVDRRRNVSISNRSTFNYSTTDENLKLFRLFFGQPATDAGFQNFVFRDDYSETASNSPSSETLAMGTGGIVPTANSDSPSVSGTYTYAPVQYNITDGATRSLPGQVIQRSGLLWVGATTTFPLEGTAGRGETFYYLGFAGDGDLRRVLTREEWRGSSIATGLSPREERDRIGPDHELHVRGTTLSVEDRGRNLKLIKTGHLPDGAEVTAWWEGEDKAGNTDQFSESLTVTEPETQNESDLSVEKTGPANVSEGENVTYTVTVTNNGPDPATGIAIRDIASWDGGDVQILDERVSAGSEPTRRLDDDGSRYLWTWTIPTLAPGESATMNVTMRVVGISDTTTLENVAFPDVLTSSFFDDNPENNRETVSTTVGDTPEADIEVSKLGPSSELAGENVTYSVFVENHGPEGATGIRITDDWNLSNGSASLVAVEEISETKKGIEWTEFDSQVGIIVTSLGPNESTRIDVTLKVPNGTGNATLTNIARRGSTDGYIDPNPENDDSGKKETPINERRIADIGVTKSGPERVGEGNVTYTVNVTNHGPDRATNVSIGMSSSYRRTCPRTSWPERPLRIHTAMTLTCSRMIRTGWSG